MHRLKMSALAAIFFVGFIIMMFFTPDGIPQESANALAMTSLAIAAILLILAG